MLQIGNKAPDFNLKNDVGDGVSLKDFKGKTVVLYFYPKDDTPGCTREACGFRDQEKVFKKKNVVIVGVSADSIESHEKFKKKYSLPFMLLSDPDKKMLSAYGVWVEKSMYGRKYMGVERTTMIIDADGKISNIFPKVKVDGHIDEVLEILN
jgi:thioredoxin-dependent peroxiredoxin